MTNLEIGKAHVTQVSRMLNVGGIWRGTNLYGPLNRTERRLLDAHIKMIGFDIKSDAQGVYLEKVK